MIKPVTFFGIPLEKFTQRSLEMKIESMLDGNDQYLVATPNPEMLMAARANIEIANILNRMNLLIADGFGLSLMARLTGQGKLRRFPGTDVLIDICRLASRRKMHVVIVGGWSDAADKAKIILESAFPGLAVSHIGKESIKYIDGEWDQPEGLIDAVQQLRPDVVAVALGSSDYSKQERWIVDHIPQLASVKIGIGVGGAIDMIGGRTRRAPEFLQKMGLEWLWRLILQPSRYSRIITAVILFPIAVIQDTITSR